MFINTPNNPTKFKRIAYLCASTFLGVLLSFIVHAIIEISYFSWAQSYNVKVVFYGSCALRPITRYLLLILGIVGGFYLGKFWWKKVYIGTSWKKKQVKK